MDRLKTGEIKASVFYWNPASKKPQEEGDYMVIIEINGKLDITDDVYHDGYWVNYDPIWWAKKSYPNIKSE